MDDVIPWVTVLLIPPFPSVPDVALWLVLALTAFVVGREKDR